MRCFRSKHESFALVVGHMLVNHCACCGDALFSPSSLLLRGRGCDESKAMDMERLRRLTYRSIDEGRPELCVLRDKRQASRKPLSRTVISMYANETGQSKIRQCASSME